MLEEKLALSVVDVELNEDLAPTTGRSWRDSTGGMEETSRFLRAGFLLSAITVGISSLIPSLIFLLFSYLVLCH
jgi:hypothetical protein